MFILYYIGNIISLLDTI